MNIRNIKYILMLSVFSMPCFTYSQTLGNEGNACLRCFNLFVYESLLSLDEDNHDLSSNNVRLILELSISKYGRIDSVILVKSNLEDLGIKEIALISQITGAKFPCLRNLYHKDKLFPKKIGVVYNTDILK